MLPYPHNVQHCILILSCCLSPPAQEPDVWILKAPGADYGYIGTKARRAVVGGTRGRRLDVISRRSGTIRPCSPHRSPTDVDGRDPGVRSTAGPLRFLPSSDADRELHRPSPWPGRPAHWLPALQGIAPHAAGTFRSQFSLGLFLLAAATRPGLYTRPRRRRCSRLRSRTDPIAIQVRAWRCRFHTNPAYVLLPRLNQICVLSTTGVHANNHQIRP